MDRAPMPRPGMRLAAVASVALAMALGTRLFGTRAGRLAGFLTAISMHHVDHQWCCASAATGSRCRPNASTAARPRYRSPDDEPMAVERRGDPLFAQIANRFPFALVAESDSAFHARAPRDDHAP